MRIETSHRESSQGDEMYLRSASSMHCAPATRKLHEAPPALVSRFLRRAVFERVFHQCGDVDRLSGRKVDSCRIDFPHFYYPLLLSPRRAITASKPAPFL